MSISTPVGNSEGPALVAINCLEGAVKELEDVSTIMESRVGPVSRPEGASAPSVTGAPSDSRGGSQVTLRISESVRIIRLISDRLKRVMDHLEV